MILCLLSRGDLFRVGPKTDMSHFGTTMEQHIHTL